MVTGTNYMDVDEGISVDISPPFLGGGAMPSHFVLVIGNYGYAKPLVPLSTHVVSSTTSTLVCLYFSL